MTTFWDESGAVESSAMKRARRQVKGYGITPEEWVAMWRGQGGACCICGAPLRNRFGTNPKGKVGAVDHDHALATRSGMRASVRGLICTMPCNRLLTNFWTPAKLRAAASYLEDPPARRFLLLREA